MKTTFGQRALGTTAYDTKDASQRPLVNYVWITSRKPTPSPYNKECAVELANIESAVSNANRHPEADFQLWLDKKVLDDYSLFCIDYFLHGRTFYKNIKIADLQTIPDYANDPFFTPLEPTDPGYAVEAFCRVGPRNVYARADYARILVLDHCLITQPERPQIIYSDIDCPSLRLTEVSDRIRRHGIAINGLGGGISNGYIGLDPNYPDLRRHFETLKQQSTAVAHQNGLGYSEFGNFLEALGVNLEDVGIQQLLPRIGHEMPHHDYKLASTRQFKTWKKNHPHG